jgi:hypothetical protein
LEADHKVIDIAHQPGFAPLAAWASSGIAGHFLTFLTRAWLSFALSTGRMSLGQRTSTELIPKLGSILGFDIF